MKSNTNIYFEKRFIAYLDILGFKEFVKLESFQSKAQIIYNIIEESIVKGTEKNSHGIYPNGDIAKTVISDSIILSIPFDPQSPWKDQTKALRFLLSAVEKIQLSLAINNIWTRGAVSAGSLSHTETNIVGKGLVNAYLLEQQAKFPRVLVDSKVLQIIYASNPGCETRSHFVDEINLNWGNSDYSGKFLYDWGASSTRNHFTDDYPFFVHYLNKLLEKDMDEQRTSIYENLKSKMYEKSPDIYQKYRWITDYLITFTGASNDSDYINEFHEKLRLL